MKREILLSLATVFASQAATAGTLDLSYNGAAAPGYGVVTIDTVLVDVAGHDTTVYAGGFDMYDSSLGGLEDFVAWCLDLGAYLGTSGSYGYETTETPFQNGSQQLLAAGMARVSSLFDANYSDAITATTDSSAAFQVALWEAVYDDDMNIGTGGFQVTGSDNVESLASGYLAAAAAYSGPSQFDLTYLESDGEGTARRQNLVTATPTPAPVPVPASGLMLLAAVGAGAAMRRRQAK